MKDNIKAGLLTLFLGAIGDIISRTVWYNCSIDRAWTMLFALPPLSIVPAVFYFLNKIEKAELGCKTAFDIFLFILPVLTIAIEFAAGHFIESDMVFYIVTFIAIFALYAMVRTYRTNKNCELLFKDKNKGFNWSIVKRALFVSLVTNGAISTFNALSPFGEFIPIIGIGFRLWGYLGNIPGLQHAILLTIAHFVMNLKENLPETLEDVCTKGEYPIDLKMFLPDL
jgi:hypothetical protein